MLLKELINKSVYGTIGYISDKHDINVLEQYIAYNYSVLKEYKQIIVVANYPTTSKPEMNLFLEADSETIWKKYFPDCIILKSKQNRGPHIGYCDLDNIIFEYCKKNNIEWLCKSANDILLQSKILDKEIDEADFYYLNGIGYAGMEDFGFDLERVQKESFYPQTNFYFINTYKVNSLSDMENVNQTFNKIQEFGGNIWENGFKGCERMLKEEVEKNSLLKFHLVSQENYSILLKMVKEYPIHDPSHKNILIEGICHLAYPNSEVISI